MKVCRTTPVAGHTIETWWDPHCRSWVTQLNDPAGNQIGEADFSGTREDAVIAHNWLVERTQAEEANAHL